MNELINESPPDHLNLIALTQHQLIRVYPRALRQDSSNLHPLFYWTYGMIIQLIEQRWFLSL